MIVTTVKSRFAVQQAEGQSLILEAGAALPDHEYLVEESG
jgi:hypothetical protein